MSKLAREAGPQPTQTRKRQWRRLWPIRKRLLDAEMLISVGWFLAEGNGCCRDVYYRLDSDN
jgi:hypothetical protein